MYTKKPWFLPHHWSGFYPIDFPFNQSWHHCVWLSRSLQELDFGVQRTRNINKATSRSGQYIYIYYSIICLHVCIYIYIYIKTVRLHKSAHTYTCMCIYIYWNVCIYFYVHVHELVHIQPIIYFYTFYIITVCIYVSGNANGHVVGTIHVHMQSSSSR